MNRKTVKNWIPAKGRAEEQRRARRTADADSDYLRLLEEHGPRVTRVSNKRP